MLGEELMAELCAAALGWGILDPANARHNLGSSRHAWRGWIRTTWKPGQQNVLIGNKTIVNGEPVTFSRGGSDTSEGFGAFAISAGMCFNMTDGGASSADPEIVGPDRVQPLAHLLYDEGRELGRNGTGLFHPAAMVPLMLGDIPTRICSTFDPDAPFTTLDNDKSRAEYRAGRIIALSLMKDVVVYTVHEPGMAEASGRLKAFDAALAKRHITIIDSEGDGVDRQRFYVGANSADMAAEALLRSTRRKGGELSRTSPLSFITLVGYDLWRRYIDNTFNLALGNGALGKQWQSQNYPISHGSHSIRIGVPSNEALTTLSALHGKFVESSYASAHLYDKS
jgi:aspartokinase